ncbi:unnamed protein product [Agarophyton chilense]
MVSTVRRRALATSSNSDFCPSIASPSHKSFPISSRAICILSILLTASLFSIHQIIRYNRSDPITIKLLAPNATSDDEESLSFSRIQADDYVHPNFRARGAACMPSVTRIKGGIPVEYVSNAVKSWRLATNQSLDVRQLTVFDMDLQPAARPSWLDNVFDTALTDLPSWLKLSKRERPPIPHRKVTLGDDERRVEWRSKEALDYADVLLRCMEENDVEYIIVVQDDVLFREQMKNVIQWCDKHLKESFVTNAQGRPKQIRMCSASLFDLSGGEADAHELRSSNMVARVWRRDFVQSMARYLTTNFDEAPVDWLADRRCRTQKRKTIVMEPNPVRHRGRISSFPSNLREKTIT